ncbi:hypothetical protein CHO01_29070 [Cellulomonas hominis]|uniref:Uncharacterized protein n=1 Tax=Cellulomonas hominis TaxID=156981 RepID=A0A511FEY4_9CELL|nr:hypothetical protein [Cellulomonas hominis]MBB5474744.1 hypothetical protein [Cellulomonas hominis]NKY05400.1 hypothetical protein [Cellulomonas hominis]GEL47791.1 hypothetical protein CHO01_29070 [Cellulomonas hominis]
MPTPTRTRLTIRGVVRALRNDGAMGFTFRRCTGHWPWEADIVRLRTALHRTAALRDGWWGPGSLATEPAAAGVAGRLVELADRRLGASLASFMLGPSSGSAGGIVIESIVGDLCLTLDIDAAGQQGYFVADDRSTDALAEGLAPLEPNDVLAFWRTGTIPASAVRPADLE